MGEINPAYNDRIRHTLQHDSMPPMVITEPEGWDEDQKEYARSKTMDGVFPKFSNALSYVGNGKDFINNIRDTFGPNARIRDIKDVKDDDNRWVRAYSGYLDMMTWKKKDNKVSIQFNSGGLEQIRKSREKDKVEIERTTAITGTAIPELVPSRLSLRGRRIFLKTVFDVKSSANTLKLDVESNAGNTRSTHGGIPLSLFSQSHDLANSVIPETSLGDPDENKGTTGIMFYALNDRTRTIDIKLDVSLDAFFQQYENVQWCSYGICLSTYENGIAYDLKDRFFLKELRSPNVAAYANGLWTGQSSDAVLPKDKDFAYPQFTKQMTASFDGTIELLKDESLSLEIFLKSDMYVDVNAGVRVYAKNIAGNLTMEEDSFVEDSVVNAVLPYELFERLIQIMTGATGNFRSSYFGRKDLGYAQDGEGAYLMVSSGMWIRQFTKENELYKPFTTSFADAIQAYMTAKNISLGIEKLGNREYFVIEKKDYFYNTNITVRLGSLVNGKFQYTQANEVEREVAKELVYSSITIGAEKGGEYEEVMGLEETNTQANFTTPIDAHGAKEFKMLSKYRFDPYGAEIIRRRSILTHPTTDQSGDQDIWMFDAKPSLGGVYELKTWQDVLAKAPVGMFSPETSYNFLFSPVQLMLEHGPWIATGMTKNLFDMIRFGSSTGKSSVSLQRIGGIEYAENGNITVNDLGKPVYLPEEVKFEWQVDVEFLKIVEGHTVANGRKIPNVYATFEFLNEDRLIERAFLMSLKPNKEGKWEVLKANRTLKEYIP